jgi:Gpi18-like mannosyltransferase
MKKELKLFFKLSPFLLLLAILYTLLLPQNGFVWDINCWKVWCIYIFDHGLSHVYSSETDYLPVFHYILYFFGCIQGSVNGIEKNIYYLKLFTLLFDFIAGWYIIKILAEKFDNHYEVFSKSLFYFLGIGIIYNSLIWGQVDGILSCLVFLSFYYAYKSRISYSLIFYIIAINFKFQGIIFLPFIGLILLPHIVSQFNWKVLIKWILATCITQLLILIPFIYTHSVDRVTGILTHYSSAYPVMSMNAYNFWYLILSGNLREVKDAEIFMGLTYKNWGLLLFFATSFAALFPMLKSLLQALKIKKQPQLSLETLLLIGALLPLLFFYCNTQMHERYIHPCFIFLTLYCILKNNIGLLILGSFAYLLNLEGVMHYFSFMNYGTLIFHPRFISILYLLLLIFLFVDLYRASGLEPDAK